MRTLREIERVIRVSIPTLRRVAGRAGSYYQSWDLRQEGSRKWRHIDHPTGELKEVQSALQSRLLSRLPLHPQMYGGVSGRSHLDAATLHLRQDCVACIDIRDFFPSTSNDKVYRTFVRVGFGPRESRLLTQLTTFQHRLPQGAATSVTIGNLVLAPLCADVVALCTGLNVSFFIDDITISGPGDRVRATVEPTVRLIQRHGYKVRHKKIVIRGAARCQQVLKVVVNRPHLSRGREKIQEIRDALIALKGAAAIPRSIAGRIGYAGSIAKHQGAALLRFAERVLHTDSVATADEVKAGDLRRPCRCFNRSHQEPEKLADTPASDPTRI